MTSKPWYQQGLKFKCTECGKCCSGFPGYVWLEEEDIQKLADHLGLSTKDFLMRYTRQVGNKISLVELKKDHDCVFYRDKKCSVYKARPKQCRTYPFWDSVLKSRATWEEEKEYCEGVDHPDGTLIPLSEIEKKLR